MKLAIEHLKAQVEAGPAEEAKAQAALDAARQNLQAAIDAARTGLKSAESDLAHVQQRNADFAELYEAAKLGKLPKSDETAEVAS